MVKRPSKDLRSLLSGSATFVGDIDAGDDELRVSFLRSPTAHARIRRIEASGVGRSGGSSVRVLTMADLRDLVSPGVWREFPLAEEEVVYRGQPVAAVAGPDPLALEDCLERVEVEYEPLPVVSDPAGAIARKERWLSTAASNVVFRRVARAGRPAESLEGSPHTLELEFHLPRLSPYPLEGRGIVIERGRAGSVVYSSTQSPDQLQKFLMAAAPGSGKVRVIQAAVGGAFGGKIFPCAEDLACYLISSKLKRSVKWVPSPQEELVTLNHRPDQTHQVRVGYDGSGRVLSLRDRVTVDAGAYFAGLAGGPLGRPGSGPPPRLTSIEQMVSMATGPYGIRDVEVRVAAVATNKVMMGPIRGSGGMVATFVLERVMNQVGLALGLDQFSVRRANLVGGSPSGRNAFGAPMPQLRTLDLLEVARSSSATRALLRDGRRRGGRGEGRPDLSGVGLSFYLAESAPPSAETVRLELTRGGKLVLSVGVAPTGSGSERTLATIVEKRLRPGRSEVEVRSGDTETSHHGPGTLSSRSVAYAGSATLLACRLLVDRMKELLRAGTRGRAPTPVAFRAGTFRVASGTEPTRVLDFVDAARELGSGVAVDATYSSESSTFSAGCHVALVSVDAETGSVRVVRHLAFEDFGTVLDEAALTAQTEGGVLQSIGEALHEEVAYDPSGAADRPYTIPSAPEAPTFFHALVHLTRSQHLHGARGAGEAGRIGSIPAVVNAVENALSGRVGGVFLGSTPVSPDALAALLAEGRAVR
ncbi:MAG: xanthine dehydrogenase family protein molybdopterin-binding subunit [Nitrososphaerales archaeon]